MIFSPRVVGPGHAISLCVAIITLNYDILLYITCTSNFSVNPPLVISSCREHGINSTVIRLVEQAGAQGGDSSIEHPGFRAGVPAVVEQGFDEQAVVTTSRRSLIKGVVGHVTEDLIRNPGRSCRAACSDHEDERHGEEYILGYTRVNLLRLVCFKFISF